MDDERRLLKERVTALEKQTRRQRITVNVLVVAGLVYSTSTVWSAITNHFFRQELLSVYEVLMECMNKYSELTNWILQVLEGT